MTNSNSLQLLAMPCTQSSLSRHSVFKSYDPVSELVRSSQYVARIVCPCVDKMIYEDYPLGKIKNTVNKIKGCKERQRKLLTCMHIERVLTKMLLVIWFVKL